MEWPLHIKSRYGKGKDVTMDDEGIFDPRLKVGVIRWLDIKRAYRRRFSSTDYICIEVYDAESYIRQRSILARLVWRVTGWSGMKRFSIITNGLKANPAKLFDLIVTEVERRRSLATTSGLEN